MQPTKSGWNSQTTPPTWWDKSLLQTHRNQKGDPLVFLYSGTLALNSVSINVVNSLYYINLFLTALQKAQANYEEKQTSSRIP